MTHVVPAIPDSLRENLAYGLGEAEAERWLGDAVARAERLFVDWQLTPQQVLSGGSESLCVKCLDEHGLETVLKLPANVTGGAAEIAALRAWGGEGAARVLRTETEQNAMLMNFLGWVGEGAQELADVVSLADRLHAAPVSGHPFAALEANLARRVSWAAARFAESGDDDAARDLVAAEKLLGELIADDSSRVLLHGDYQPKNLIVSPEGLRVVDPLPVVGPEIFDLALWVVKCGQDKTLSDCICDLAAQRPQVDLGALRRWCWALAVLESRPYLGQSNAARVNYIDEARDRV